MVKSHKDISNHYYGFVNLPNQWISDNDRSYPDRFFDDKNNINKAETNNQNKRLSISKNSVKK
jgi:hypothetical protein